MKRLITLVFACLLALPAHAQTIATVNGKAITKKQQDDIVAILVARGETDTPELRERIKQDLISNLVFVQAAEKAGLHNKAEVIQALELARQSTLAQALAADYLEKNPISAAAVQARYNEISAAQAGRLDYKLRHILVEDEAAAKQLISNIRAKKTTFEAAAKKSSIDPGTSQNGGDLGWVPATQLPNYAPEFVAAVQTMKKGDLTPAPVQTQFGWHVIEVEDTRAMVFPALNAVQPQIENMLRQEALQKMHSDLIAQANIK